MIMMFLQDEIFHQEQLWHSVDQSEMISFCVDQSGAVSSLARMIRIDNSKQAQ